MSGPSGGTPAGRPPHDRPARRAETGVLGEEFGSPRREIVAYPYASPILIFTLDFGECHPRTF